ncbi:hypothetical protein PLICRDRAFT_136767 [Plicaturopsis crispa FD-325 SS-3]|nr:hypothetical protein PLICRDRAFT_136767 [Plicaturopsis crispa FD-325 SS-3]
MRLFALVPLLVLAGVARADPSGSALYPPGLLPLINRANALLSTGQFSDAAKAYTEAIEQSPADYLLYYKRATAYFSLSRHPNALDDFDKVLSLTSNSFDNALLMKAKILAKEGNWLDARDALNKYSSKVKHDAVAEDLAAAISSGEASAKRAAQAQRAQLWTACSEAASQALKTASHSVQIRTQRAECELAAGDIEGAVGDYTRLFHLSSPSTTSLMRTFRLAYFFLPASSAPLSTLKQCLHFDPDSKPCLTAHRMVKKFDKAFAKLEKLVAAEDWRGVISLLAGKHDDGLMHTFDAELAAQTTRAQLVDASTHVPLPSAHKTSPRRADLLRALCKAYVRKGDARNGERWCDALMAMDGAGSDADALVGKGEAALAKEEWEEASRYFEKAFESSGRSDRDIQQRLLKAQRLLKQSKQKDYYKVLGVPRDADAKAIKKAYRKAVMTAHPDKGGSEAKMATVNEAYEVLSKPELRQRFDNGDDPNDPHGGQGGNPFASGFEHPFAQFFQSGGPGGGGFHYQYSYGGGRGR